MSVFTSPHLSDGARWRGMRIGLLGGSFNPPHAGHVHIARLAMAKFNLDFVWWIVTPQNPLKSPDMMAPYAERFAAVEHITARHPRMMATHLESLMGTRYTYQTVRALKRRFPCTEFIWICGMDNALIFHKWDRWEELLDAVSIVFIARPPVSSLVRNCPVRMKRKKNARNPKNKGKRGISSPRVFWMKGTRMLDISSTGIRDSLKNKGLAQGEEEWNPLPPLFV